MIGTFNNKNINDNNFGLIDEIIITGFNDKEREKINNQLNKLKFENLFFLNNLKVSKIINANDLVEKYSVFKVYPNTLNINIKKTKFLAQVRKKDLTYLLGSNGKLIKTLEAKENIPFIFGEFQIDNFFKLRTALEKNNFDYNEIKNLFYFKSGRWDLETNSGIIIKLSKENIDKNLKFLISFLREYKDKEVFKIDLRQKNQVIINGR